MTYSSKTAANAANFLDSIGVNTHLDFTNSSYGNIGTVEAAINYLGVKNLRDSANSRADLGADGLWQQVANTTGAKFDAFLGEGSVATMTSGLANAVTLAKQGILNLLEGGNEEDQPYSLSLGNSLAKTAAYQQTVYDTAHSLGLKAINMSFGTGWSKPTGNYGTVGNLASVADFANAHTYFGTGNTPLSTINTLNSLAQLAANDKSVITTEMGWYTTGNSHDSSNVSPTVQAKYMLDGLMDAYQAGDARTYLYELIDQHANSSNTEYNFGLFNADGSAKPAADALHNLTSLLADSGANAASFTPGSLTYQLSGMTGTDHSMLMEKSDGTYWLAIWNEARLSGPKAGAEVSVANHTVTLELASAASEITVFDPMSGTSALHTASNTRNIAISVPDHPVLVEIGGAGGSAAAPLAPTAEQSDDVALLYAGALGRAGSTEVNYWAGILANNVSPADQAQGVLKSLGATSGGFNGGMTIADGFLNSGEFQSKFAGLDNADFVAQIYRNALHRAPETAGAQFYEHLLDTGAASRAVVLVAIAESPEAHHVNAGLLGA